MVSTPKKSKKKIKPRDNPKNNKVNISQFQGFVPFFNPAPPVGFPQANFGTYDPSPFYNFSDFFLEINILLNDLFHPETPTYDFSPQLTSSMTTPSLILDGISTPQDLNDSPLFNASFMSSPSLEPAVDFFPDLTNDPTASTTNTRSLMQLSSVP